MDNENLKDNTTSIWDKRYKDGEIVCTKQKPNIDPIDYTQHPYLYEHSIAKRITGDEKGKPIEMVANMFLNPPAQKMLAVGSGLAIVEQSLVQGGYVEKLIGYEASSVAVETAQNRIKSAGLSNQIDIRCGDVLDANFSEGEFDVVFVQAAIHHFYNIEEMFQFFHYVLKPGGLIYYDEYVGPDHHLYEPEVVSLMDEVNECLSTNYRWDVLRNQVRNEIPLASLEWMLEMDPSEGVHSSKILPLTYKYFDVEFRSDYGGTFMRPFFTGILPNFDFGDEKDQTVANLIILIETLLIRYGIIPSYHSIVLGRRLDSPRNDFPISETNRINYSNWSEFSKFKKPKSTDKIVKFSPANYSDMNWDKGVSIYDEATIFLPVSRLAISEILEGKTINFINNDVRTILNVKEISDTLIIKLSGKRLDPNIVGYPNKFTLS